MPGKKADLTPPTEADMEEFKRQLMECANNDIIPQMRSSAFCMVALLPGDVDTFLALQVGVAILLEKPLLIIAIDNAWVPQRLRQLADAVVEGPSIQDPGMRERLQAAVQQLAQARKEQ